MKGIFILNLFVFFLCYCLNIYIFLHTAVETLHKYCLNRLRGRAKSEPRKECIRRPRDNAKSGSLKRKAARK